MEENKPVAAPAPGKDYAPNQIRDRVKELRHVRARDLVPHPNNWKNHPTVQRAALHGLLIDLGIVDALIAFKIAGRQVADS